MAHPRDCSLLPYTPGAMPSDTPPPIVRRSARTGLAQSSLRQRPPRQYRARMTLAAIHEAALKILDNEGEAAFNTNRVAAVAGISVGTLYRYFPNKARATALSGVSWVSSTTRMLIRPGIGYLADINITYPFRWDFLAFGASLLVEHAAKIAEGLGISQRVISITMVAVGTSIPELVTSVIAALKKETDIAVGNILGSNIMNILAVLGITGVIGNISVDRAISHFDIPWMVGVTLLLLLLMLPAARSKITRWEGGFMIAIYLLYIYMIF